jgi:hypothetical protein
MSVFDLRLSISPSFHRNCSIRIEGEITGTATYEAAPVGLLPRATLTLPVAREPMAALRTNCARMVAAWDPRWSQLGLDGISIDVMLDSSNREPQEFSLWSPRAGTAPHMMLAAAFECFPFEHCNGKAGEQLDILRSYFDLQPPAIAFGHGPMRLRLAPWVHFKDASEIEHQVTMLPDEGELLVDASGMERFGGALARILPVDYLVKRTGGVSWKVHSGHFDELIQAGVEPSLIEVVHPVPLSSKGEPIVLGGIFISSSDLMILAKAGDKRELVRAFRKEFPLTIEQASKAATELMEIVANR